MKTSLSLIVLITLTTVYGATIKKDEVIELCQAAGKLMINGLSPISIQTVIKQRSELSEFQRPEEEADSVTLVYNSFGSKFVESMINLFLDGINRMYRESQSLPLALAYDLQTLQNVSVSSFCSKIPLPDTLDTDNPVTTLTSIVNYVNNLPPLIQPITIEINPQTFNNHEEDQ